ncbi:YrhK family protein [Microbulbifer sp. CAU 1566]|uniref:YrhK family protein n=1 Tax=Microbulbifer sp. CAU 1566 TaxID=2933269 RepID=UPI002004A46E|nr:YrhK family protein [Microbulbifer sp. CAU 1566]MCK7599130.1 YrhK family protein [Microbulbifer sp. CAU 1566]
MIKRRINMSLMIVASLFFLIGSILFLPQFANYSTVGVWCFATGSFTMLAISIADLVEDLIAGN